MAGMSRISDRGRPGMFHKMGKWRYPLVSCYMAIENGPFIVDLPIKDGKFP